jgi:hypothetical protein
MTVLLRRQIQKRALRYGRVPSICVSFLSFLLTFLFPNTQYCITISIQYSLTLHIITQHYRYNQHSILSLQHFADKYRSDPYVTVECASETRNFIFTYYHNFADKFGSDPYVTVECASRRRRHTRSGCAATDDDDDGDDSGGGNKFAAGGRGSRLDRRLTVAEEVAK